VIYCFFYFLIAVLGDEEYLVIVLKRKAAVRGEHVCPVNCCLKPWVMGQPFLQKWCVRYRRATGRAALCHVVLNPLAHCWYRHEKAA
jgi:hypothetical protein